MSEATPNEQSYKNAESPVKVKKEKPDVPETQSCKPSGVNNFIVNNPQLSQLQCRNVTVTVTRSESNGAKSYTKSSQSTTEVQSKPKENEPPAKQEPPPIDSASIRGAFGWTTVGEVHLPLLLRGDDRFVAVRMVESKIISTYLNILPWTVFACTNIKSYYVTENEAKLLNEINGFHCDFYYGYQTFSTKDVVVRLSDTVKFYEFLETCRTKLRPESCNPLFKEQCGFVVVNFKAIPYVRKEKRKYILYNMLYQEGVSAPVSCTETVSEWDMAYFRFLSYVTTVDQRYLKTGATLCSLDDLQQALGMVELEEWWPSLQYSSKSGRPILTSSDCMMPKYGDSLPFVQPEFSEKDSSGHVRDVKELQAKSCIDSFPDIDWLSAKSSSANQAETRSDSRSNLFPSSLDSLLSTPHQSNNYQLQYASQMQSSVMPNISQSLGSETGLSSLATSRPRPFPPPPPLVRLEQSPRSTTVPIIDHRTFSKNSSPLYPYMPPGVTPNNCSPWIASMLEPDWFQKNERRVTIAHQTSELANAPQSQTHILSGDDQWSAVSSGIPFSGTGSLSYARNYNVGRGLREGYDTAYSSLCQTDRLALLQRGSPRPATGAGPPPHYPTPPQSSPLQSFSLLECPSLPGLTDIYGMRSTPLDLCSPPPSPETRSSLPTSPRGNYAVSTSYQPHTVRLAQVDTRYMLAINVEPHKHNSVLAVPVSEVVQKFLRGASAESCQVALETFFGLQLYECSSLHQEAYAKHNVAIVPGCKMVAVADLRNYLFQLRFLLAEREKQKERNYQVQSSEDLQLAAKRWRTKE